MHCLSFLLYVFWNSPYPTNSHCQPFHIVCNSHCMLFPIVCHILLSVIPPHCLSFPIVCHPIAVILFNHEHLPFTICIPRHVPFPIVLYSPLFHNGLPFPLNVFWYFPLSTISTVCYFPLFPHGLSFPMACHSPFANCLSISTVQSFSIPNLRTIVLPHQCCDAILQPDFVPILCPVSVNV